MKRKRIIVALAITLLGSMLMSGCGKEEEQSNPFTNNTQNSHHTESTQESTTRENTTEESVVVSAGAMDTSATIEETVLVDEQGIKITATSLSFDKYDVEVKLLIENNSEKKIECYACTIGYSCNAINGYMISDGYFNADLEPGKKSNETVKFDIDDLLAMGITEISDIQIGIRIVDDDYDELYKAPSQIKTSLYDKHDYSINYYEAALDSGAFQANLNGKIQYASLGEVYNNNGIQIASQIGVVNNDGEYVLLLEVVNTNSETVRFRLNDITANNLVLCSSCWSADEILPGCIAVIPLELNQMIDDNVIELTELSDYSNVSYDVELENINGDSIGEIITVETQLSDSDALINLDGELLYDENGIKIIGKGVYDDSLSFSDDIHWYLLIVNNTEQEIYADEDYNSFSANGFMISDIGIGGTIRPGKVGVLDIEMMGYSLEDNGIEGAASITAVESKVIIRDSNYHELYSIPVKQEF